MPFKLRSTVAAVSILAAVAGPARAADDQAAVRQLMHAFDAAIRNHDGEGMKSLFYKREIVWNATINPAARAYVEKALGKPQEPVEAKGATEIMANAQAKAFPIAERFYDPDIVTDGQLAVATFAYDFTFNCKMTNWGLETWQLVKTDDGWRILSLLYSANLEATAPTPARHLKPLDGCTPVKPPARVKAP